MRTVLVWLSTCIPYISAEHCFRLNNNAISDERVRDCALSTHSVFRPLRPSSLVQAFKAFRPWVSRVSLHIKILRSWVSRVLRHVTILRSWVSRVPRQKGRARSKIHQGPRPWTQQTLDLGSFWDLGTSLVNRHLRRACGLLHKGQATLCVLSAQSRTRSSDIALLRSLKQCSADI